MKKLADYRSLTNIINKKQTIEIIAKNKFICEVGRF